MNRFTLARASTTFAASLALSGVSACSSSSGAPAASTSAAPHSSSMALSSDGRTLFVANPETDTVSVVDVQQRKLEGEIVLAATGPRGDPMTGNYAPAVQPRAVALSPDEKTLYVTGERSSALHVVDVASGKVRSSIHVGSEPVGLAVEPSGSAVYVACSQEGTVVKVDTAKDVVDRTLSVSGEPWALGWSDDRSRLLVTHFMGPDVIAIDPGTLTAAASWPVPDTAPRGDRRLAHGVVRGLYDVAARPGTDEVWTAHALLGIDTAQPDLDFESTAFPAVSVLGQNGAYLKTLSTNAQDVPGINGAFADVVSGPHAIAFTRDGSALFLVAANSEDVLVVDTNTGVEIGLVRPLPGHMPDGIVLSPDEQYAYVDERISGDVAVLRLDRSSGALVVTVDGAPIPRLASDPMQPYRLGQQLFNSANSTEYPVTTDHWIACATCHMEGRSDAVTWKFAQGPRDTPTNAGGMMGTGFLFRTADRTQVQDYWRTIDIEQGGQFDVTAQAPLLDAIADYVNHAIPLPVPPTTDPTLVARGQQLFQTVGCNVCHSGPRFTDSGSGNPTLDLHGKVLLHDIGTCDEWLPGLVGAALRNFYPDVPHQDIAGDPRDACQFDTPSLSGAASTPPYLHDGSAPTIRDAIRKMPNAPTSPDDLDALAEYVRSL